MKSRLDIKEWLKSHIESAYHASCTLPMGKVVDN
jgi:choline dehydrogenase-like flavoprotein